MALSPTASKATAIGVLVALIVVVAAAVGLPAWHYYATQRAEAEELQDNIRRYRAISARAGDVTRRLDAARNAEITDFVISADRPQLASLEAQAYLVDILRRNGVVADRVQFLNPEAFGELTRVGLQVLADTTLEALVQALTELESGKPIATVEAMTLRPVGQQQPDEQTPQVLRARLEIYVHALIGDRAEAKSEASS